MSDDTRLSLQPRDFLETADGLVFAAVEAELEGDRALSFLRYRRDADQWRKLLTNQANAWLSSHAPDYLYYSIERDARLHGVPWSQVAVHHQPRARLARLRRHGPSDAVEARLCRLLTVLAQGGADLSQVGMTGSLLIGAQGPNSDFDLVVYGRPAFQQLRQTLVRLLEAGLIDPLDEALWQESYARRGCELDYADYLRHEQRKYNKAAFEGTKFDLTLVHPGAHPHRRYRKRGLIQLRAEVLDAEAAFDYPARYQLNHPDIHEALSFTNTYAGQALPGETVEISGHLEQADDGLLQIVVGSSREAPGEYIRVVSA